MTDLENVLEEFKTNEGDEEELQEAIDDNAINTVISDELRAQLEADFHELDSDIDFNPDAVEEMDVADVEEVGEEKFTDETAEQPLEETACETPVTEEAVEEEKVVTDSENEDLNFPTEEEMFESVETTEGK